MTCLSAAVSSGRRHAGDVAVALQQVGPSRCGRRPARGRAGRCPRSIREPEREHDRVVARVELVDRQLRPDVDAVLEGDPRLLEQRDAAVDDPLLELEVGHAEADQAARALVALVDDDAVPGGVELLGDGQPRRPGADDADRPARVRMQRRLAAAPSPRGSARSMIPHSSGLIITGSSLIASTHAASHGAGQIRPVNSGKLLVACRRSIASAPLAAAHEVVPLRDQVAERAALVAERDAAVHAAPALLAQLVRRAACRRSRGGRRCACAGRAPAARRARPPGTRADRPSGAPPPARRARSSARLVVVRDDLHEAAPRSKCASTSAARPRAGPLAVLEQQRVDDPPSSSSSASSPTSVWLQREANRRRRRARRRSRRSSPPRSCARSGRARPRARRSCTRSRGRRTPSTTASAPELRTAKRSPARPRKNAARSSRRRASCCPRSRPRRRPSRDRSGRTAITPPDRPLPA